MATHFLYKHLPASGLGLREPTRPYVTGGIGAARYLEYFIVLADMLLYQATLGGGLLVTLSLAEAASRVATSVAAVAAVLDEAAAIVDVEDVGDGATVDDGDIALTIDDATEATTMTDVQATATMVDRATVVTLTDTKVG